MPIKHMILGVLAGGEAHGYGIGERLSWLPGNARPVESSRLYAALVALERDRLVAARLEPCGRGRSRRLFRLTAKGERELGRWLMVPVAAGEWLRRPLLTRVALAGGASAATRATWRADWQLRRRELAGLREAASAAGGRSSRRTPRGPRDKDRPDPLAPWVERLALARAGRHIEIELELLAELLARAGEADPPGAGEAAPEAPGPPPTEA